MLLAIDIGNTNINFGVFSGNKIIRKFFIPTHGWSLRGLKNKIGTRIINDAVICSVVPKAEKTLTGDLKRLLRKQPYILGRDIFVPVKNLYRSPEQVGQDRLVNAYAGIKLYGAPLIAVDFGTAITFDVISQKKEYLGGMILPGLRISLDTLARQTALLPRVNLAGPKEFIGRDTKNSMLSGIVYGYGCLTECMTAKIKALLGKNTKVIGTGGNIQLIIKYCRAFDKIDADLTLKGLNLIYRHTKTDEK